MTTNNLTLIKNIKSQKQKKSHGNPSLYNTCQP